MHHVKRAGEFVLMDVRCSIHPKQELDVEPRVAVDDKFGLAIFDRLLAADDVLGAKRDEYGVADSYTWNEVWSTGLWDNLADW